MLRVDILVVSIHGAYFKWHKYMVFLLILVRIEAGWHHCMICNSSPGNQRESFELHPMNSCTEIFTNFLWQLCRATLFEAERIEIQKRYTTTASTITQIWSQFFHSKSKLLHHYNSKFAALKSPLAATLTTIKTIWLLRHDHHQ